MVVAATRLLFQRTETDALFVVTNPPFLPHLAHLTHVLRGTPYAVLVWDLYPDHLVHMGWIGASSPIVKMWTAMNRLALSRATVVITIGERLGDAIRAQLGANASATRIEIISNWADTNQFRPMPKCQNPFAVAQRQCDKLTVLYSGNIGATHDLSALLEGARLLRDEANVEFLIVGTGLGLGRLQEWARTRKLSRVRFLEPVDWTELPAVLACADIAVVAQSAASAHLSVPSKTFNYLAAGAALLALAPERSDLATLITTFGVGTVCDPTDGVSVANSIRRYLADRNALDRARAAAREAAEGAFSTEVAQRRFSEVLGQYLFSAANSEDSDDN